jgi:DNA processing protein
MKYSLWLSGIPGIGPAKIRMLIEAFGSAREVYFAPEEQILSVKGLSDANRESVLACQREQDVDRAWWELNEKGISFTSMEYESYPSRLRDITNPPYCLFYRGSLPDDAEKNVAIVGARSRSAYGQGVARMLSQKLAEGGVGIISGLAMGIDADAHQGALDGAGKTYAVLGCGVDVCYPARNRFLYEQIPQHGCVLSEYPPGMQPISGYFPARNRIIAGLSDCVIVIEAREKSGSLITADCAMEQGKDVYALPGRITDPLSCGTNRLISQGAGIISDIDDFLKDWAIIHQGNLTSHNFHKNLLEKEEMLVYSELDFRPIGIGTLMERTSLKLTELLDVLTRLQEKGFVREIAPNYFTQVV